MSLLKVLRFKICTPLATARARAVFGCAVVSVCAASALAQPGSGPTPVVVAEVVEQSVKSTQTFMGTVLPSKRATIGSAVDGRVVECPIEEGDRVEAGQMLAQLLTETINLELATAKSELAYKQAQLDELKNGTRPEQIAQARAKMASAAARREYTIGRRDRLQEIVGTSGAVTEDEWLEAVASALEAGELYAQNKAAYDEAVAGPRAELIAQAQAQVDMQEAVVQKLADQIAKHTIRSRFAGYVVQKQSEIGDWVNRGDAVAEVVAIDQVDVVAQVVEQSIPFVSPGAEVEVEIPALAQTRGGSPSPFKGVVLAAVPQGDLKARTFPVKIRVANQSSPAGPLIKPGMYARVNLPVGEERQSMLVPKDAVVLGQQTRMVYTVAGASEPGAAGKAVPVPVTLGRAQGELIEVTGDLQPGQLVVTEGNERLRPGQDLVILRKRAAATVANANSATLSQ